VKHRGEFTQYADADKLNATVTVWRHFLAGTPIKMIKLSSDIRIPGWTPEKVGL
jgi:hypothetical protein